MGITFNVNVVNTGEVTTTYYVGASMLSNISGSGCSLGLGYGGFVIEDLAPYTVTLAPGQNVPVTFSFGDPGMSGTFYAVSKIYTDYGLTQCLSGCYNTYTHSPPGVPPEEPHEEPPIDPTAKATISVSTPYRDPSAYSLVKNTGQTPRTFYVGMSVMTAAAGSGCALGNAGTFIRDLPVQTVTLEPGQSRGLEFLMGSLGNYAFQSITAIGKIYSESDLHPYSCLDGDSSSVMLT